MMFCTSFLRQAATSHDAINLSAFAAIHNKHAIQLVAPVARLHQQRNVVNNEFAARGNRRIMLLEGLLGYQG